MALLTKFGRPLLLGLGVAILFAAGWSFLLAIVYSLMFLAQNFAPIFWALFTLALLSIIGAVVDGLRSERINQRP